MRLKTLAGKAVFKNVESRRVNWSGGSRSKIQQKIKQFVHKIWLLDRVYEEFPVYGTRLSLDLYNANRNIAIEIQGKQHTSYIEHFQRDRANFLHQLKKDEDKAKFCNINGIILIEIFEEEMKEMTFEKFKDIYDKATK